SVDVHLAEEMMRQLREAFASLDVRLSTAVEESELRGFDLLLQITPDEAAIERILALDDPRPPPKVERFGWRKMGLHFLDKGLFLRSQRGATLFDWEKTGDLHETGRERRLFYASLSSPAGVFVYLHALFKS